MPEPDFKIPNDPDVSSDDIQQGVILKGADLSDSVLIGADLSEAIADGVDVSDANLSKCKLTGVDLSNSDLENTNLSDADLANADISGAKLNGANLSRARLVDSDLSDCKLISTDLSEAELHNADLSGANLRRADFSEADLTGSDMSNTLIWDTSLSSASFSRRTNVDPPYERLRRLKFNSVFTYKYNRLDLHDTVARANHELRAAYSNNGFIGRARDARVRERRARRREAKADATYKGTAAWAGSLLSRWTTGYGVKLLPVIGLMTALFVGSAAVYLDAGMGVQESLYYSIVTFTTSPPSPPESGMMRWVAMVETFFGTTAIIFLGYVLGNRERV